MELNIVAMKKWQAKTLNAVAWLIGIRGEDVYCMTLTKGAIDEYRKEKEKPVGKPRHVVKGKKYKGDGYCVKCKEKRTFEGVIKISDSGRQMATGKCPDCGTNMNRILGKAQ